MLPPRQRHRIIIETRCHSPPPRPCHRNTHVRWGHTHRYCRDVSPWNMSSESSVRPLLSRFLRVHNILYRTRWLLLSENIILLPWQHVSRQRVARMTQRLCHTMERIESSHISLSRPHHHDLGLYFRYTFGDVKHVTESTLMVIFTIHETKPTPNATPSAYHSRYYQWCQCCQLLIDVRWECYQIVIVEYAKIE